METKFIHDLIIILIAIPIHELGHAISFKLLGRTPQFAIVKDVFLYSPGIYHKGNPFNNYERIIVGLSGIAFGLTLIFFSLDKFLFILAYTFGCMSDIIKVLLSLKSLIKTKR